MNSNMGKRLMFLVRLLFAHPSQAVLQVQNEHKVKDTATSVLKTLEQCGLPNIRS